MQKLILRTKFSLGDVVMMTAAVRDLHRCYPGRFQTDVRTHFPEIWENNPYLTCLDEKEVEVLDCRYPLINHANTRPYHCVHGYIEFLNEKLGLRVVPTEFKGDIHLSTEEKDWASQVHELAGCDLPFWIVAAGGKHDITIKWWSTERYQEVVDRFRGKIAFVQVGELGHHHPKLNGAIDLRGQTSVRELIRLVYHAQGCLCGVTALMHLAAAVGTRPGAAVNRPCVVIAGGREPVHWEAYPHHQFLHTLGALACCADGGCWKSRVAALGDGSSRDKSDELCSQVSHGLPRCMEMITAEWVVQRIETYFRGGATAYLAAEQRRASRRAISASLRNTYDLDCLSKHSARTAMAHAIRALPKYPARKYRGRGVVICGGGLKYFPCAWVCIRMLRHVGCRLPVQLWYEGAEEMDRHMIELLEPFGVQCVNSRDLEKKHPRRTSEGWELKAYALIHTSFSEVLLLDADNVPVKDPTALFEAADYKRWGSLFWPDYGRLAPDRKIWDLSGVRFQDEPEFETGQMLVNKKRCWRALNLAFWFNNHSDFFFQYIHGDKETFHMSWRKLEQTYGMIPTPIESLDGIMCQHDAHGKRIFQHRNSHKWKAFGPNTRVPGFKGEEICLDFLKELELAWDGKIHLELNGAVKKGEFVFRGGTCDAGVFRDVFERNEYKLPARFGASDVILDIGAHIGSFSYACLKRGARRILAFEPETLNCKLARYNLREYVGTVRIYQKAVWRSDRHAGPLLHSGYPEAERDVNTGGGTVLLSGETDPFHRRKEVVQSISLDSILQRFKQVALLKLDCEGSEWPILLTSKQLHKVRMICGEYHELQEIPTVAQVAGCRRFTHKELESFLKARYRKVRLEPHRGANLGHFWAEA
jgi:FkbM family methyltransferase